MLNNLLGQADYTAFWTTLDSDELYLDLVADVSGFDELMRVRVAVTVSQAVREVERGILESWLNLHGAEFEHFVGTVCGWRIEENVVKVPSNKDNEAKGTVVRENVKFDRKLCLVLSVVRSVLDVCTSHDAAGRMVHNANVTPHRVFEVDKEGLRATCVRRR